MAVNRIIDIIRNVSHGAAPTPKVSYKNLSDNSATSNTKPLLGAAPGLPAVGVSEHDQRWKRINSVSVFSLQEDSNQLFVSYLNIDETHLHRNIQCI